MQTKALSCIRCSKLFHVPPAFYERLHAGYECDACAEPLWVLAHPHRLSLLVDSFMMMRLLSLVFSSTRGISHHLSFGKLLSAGFLPLIGAKFRQLI